MGMHEERTSVVLGENSCIYFQSGVISQITCNDQNPIVILLWHNANCVASSGKLLQVTKSLIVVHKVLQFYLFSVYLFLPCLSP